MTRTSYFGLLGHLGRMAGEFPLLSLFVFWKVEYLASGLVKETAASLDCSGEAQWASIEQS